MVLVLEVTEECGFRRFVSSGKHKWKIIAFYTNDLWCRGVFGARERSVMVVYSSYAYVFTKVVVFQALIYLYLLRLPLIMKLIIRFLAILQDMITMRKLRAFPLT